MPEFEQDKLREEEERGGFLESDSESFSLASSSASDAHSATSKEAPSAVGAHEKTSVSAAPEISAAPKILLDETPAAEKTEQERVPPQAEKSAEPEIPHIGFSEAESFEQRLRFATPPPPSSPQADRYSARRAARQAASKQRSWLSRNAVAVSAMAVVVLVGAAAAYILLSGKGFSPKEWVQRVFQKRAAGQTAQTSGDGANTSSQTSSQQTGNALQGVADSSAKAQTNANQAVQTPGHSAQAHSDSGKVATRDKDAVAGALEAMQSSPETTRVAGAPSEPQTQAPSSQNATGTNVETTRALSRAEQALARKQVQYEAREAAKTSQATKSGAHAQQSAESSNAAPRSKKRQSQAAAKSSVRKPFAVQVFATPYHDEAEQLKRRLIARGAPHTVIVSGDAAGRFMHRVRFGRFATIGEAERAARKFGFSETWVIR